MTVEQQALLTKADESLAVAMSLHAGGHYDFAASRAYYAMFYLAEALLLGRGLTFSSHSAVIAAFGKEFVRTGEIAPEFHKYLRGAEVSRIVGDYETLEHVSADRCEEHIRQGQEFLAMAERILRG